MATKISEFINNVSDPMVQRSLQAIWEAVDVEVNALRTLANELRADHATQKTSHDAVETLVEELRTDHLSTGTSYQPWLTEVDADLDKINDYLYFLNERDGVISGAGGTEYTIATTGAATLLGAGRVKYRIGGIEYECDLDTTITLEGGGVFDITAVKFAAWRVLIDKYGTVTTQSDVATGDKAHASAEIALRALGKRAITANTVEIAYVTLEGLDAAVFDVGTTNTNHAEAAFSVNYIREPRLAVGLAADMSIDLQVSANDLCIKHGTVYPRVRQSVQAVIAAADDVGFTDSNTITASKFGGHLICTDLASTALFTIAADGDAGTASLMAYETSAAAHTALDAVQAALPACFVTIGRVVVEADASTFTYNTDDIAGSDGTGVFTSETFAELARVTVAGTGVGINAPAIPDSVTAAVPAGIGSAAPASGPDSLSAAAISDSLEGQ